MESFSSTQPWKLYSIRTADDMRFDAYDLPRHFPSSRYRASSVQYPVVPTCPPRLTYPPFLASLLHPLVVNRPQRSFPLPVSNNTPSTGESLTSGTNATLHLLRKFLFSAGSSTYPVSSSSTVSLLPQRKHSTFLCDRASVFFSAPSPSPSGSLRSRQIRRASLLVVVLLLWGLSQSRRVRRFLAALLRRFLRFLKLFLPSSRHHRKRGRGGDDNDHDSHGKKRQNRDDDSPRGAGQPRRAIRRDRHGGSSGLVSAAEEGTEGLLSLMRSSRYHERENNGDVQSHCMEKNPRKDLGSGSVYHGIHLSNSNHSKGQAEIGRTEGTSVPLRNQLHQHSRVLSLSPQTERWIAKCFTAPGSLVSTSSSSDDGATALETSGGYPSSLDSDPRQRKTRRSIYASSSAGDLIARDRNSHLCLVTSSSSSSSSSIHDVLRDFSLYIEAASSTPAHISPEPVNTNVPSCFFLPSLASTPFYSSQNAVGEGVSSNEDGSSGASNEIDEELLPGLRSSFDAIPHPSSLRSGGEGLSHLRRRRESLNEKFARSTPPPSLGDLHTNQKKYILTPPWRATQGKEGFLPLSRAEKKRREDETSLRKTEGIRVDGDTRSREKDLLIMRAETPGISPRPPSLTSSLMKLFRSLISRRHERKAPKNPPIQKNNALVALTGKEDYSSHPERILSTGTTTTDSSTSSSGSTSPVLDHLPSSSSSSLRSSLKGNFHLLPQKAPPTTSLQKFTRIVRLAFPGLLSAEGGCLVLLVAALILRTFLSIWIASLNGGIVETIVERDLKKFLRRLANLIAYALPAAAVNAGIQFLEKMLGLMLRRNLTRRLMRKYLKGLTFYQMSALDTRLPHPDEVLTSSLSSFTILVASLFSSFLKPLVDIIFLSRTLVKHLGIGAPLTLVGWYILTAVAMHAVAPPLGKKTARLQELEGKYRALQADVLQHSEEIAFYGGSSHAARRLDTSFDGLYAFKQQVLVMYHLVMGSLDTLLAKHLAVVVGYAVVAAPTFKSASSSPLLGAQFKDRKISGRQPQGGLSLEERRDNSTSGITATLMASRLAGASGGDASQPAVQITHDYIRNSSLLINLAKAIGRIVMAYKDVQQLSGITSRVHAFLQVLDDLKLGIYCSRNPVTG
ncbi:abc atp-binding domain-containing protein [Cystoisospora suis]|uniref:Abc atp-binding domain-containing protein n=1 Tax=Cystoisospora suis TaxID=483139 RepID=A0A2C6JQM9_9APIC|nr:abc atp-binding domain-containing protein [Cystoisospora suis]